MIKLISKISSMTRKG